MALDVFGGDAKKGSATGDLSGAGHIDVLITELWADGRIMQLV